MLAFRLHVDESGIDNGPLRVIAGSHRSGRLSAEQIRNWNKETSVICSVPKGERWSCALCFFMRRLRVPLRDLGE